MSVASGSRNIKGIYRIDNKVVESLIFHSLFVKMVFNIDDSEMPAGWTYCSNNVSQSS